MQYFFKNETATLLFEQLKIIVFKYLGTNPVQEFGTSG